MESIFKVPSDPQIGWAGGGTGTVHTELDTADLAVFQFKDEDDTPVYWDLFVTEINEAFSEGNSIQDVLGDTFTGMATGAHPTGITITGYLLKLKEFDSRVDFLDVYNRRIRGSAVQAADRELQFLLKQSTRFTFMIQSLQVQESVESPEFTLISMQGVAFNYQVVALGTGVA